MFTVIELDTRSEIRSCESLNQDHKLLTINGYNIVC